MFIVVPLADAVKINVARMTSAVVVHEPPSGTPNGALASAVKRPLTLSTVPRLVNCVSIDNGLPCPSTQTTSALGLSIVQNAAFGVIVRNCTTLGSNLKSNCRPRMPVPALILIGTEKVPPTGRLCGSIITATGALGADVAVGGIAVFVGGTGVFVTVGVGVLEAPVPTTKFPIEVENVLVTSPGKRLIPLGPGIFTFSNTLIDVPLAVPVNRSVAITTSAVVVHEPPSGTPNGALANAVNRPTVLLTVPRFVNWVSIDSGLPCASTQTTSPLGLSIVQNAGFGVIVRSCTTLGLKAKSNCKPRIPVPARIVMGTEKVLLRIGAVLAGAVTETDEAA